ncbi:hypothetical protein BGZ99_006490 [Dissophora globulifera]|uniref:P-loop containing nucleoside triphosphate hydrolase protein n=1 Tax=Dissophora globulifera TaxID=979702 RepID=A0A9P6UZS1_9FUNG|nr:hypothetical protein BGZ99_006490 [Dissophora globulifera]
MIAIGTSVLVLRSASSLPANELDSQSKLTFAMTLFLLQGFVLEAWPRGGTRVQQESGASAYDKANLCSRCTFYFFQPIVSLSIKRTITVDDIQNQLPEFMQSAPSCETLEKQWYKNVEQTRSRDGAFGQGRKKQPVSLFRTILQVHSKAFVPILFFRTIRPALLYSIPGMLSLFLAYLQDAGTDNAKSFAYGLFLAVAISGAALIGALLQAVSRQYSIQRSLQTQVALTAMVYRKSLRLSPDSKNKSTTGEIMNRMSIDAQVWGDAILFLSMWVSLPVEICSAMWLCKWCISRQYHVRWSFMAGVLALVGMTPLQVWRARVYNKMQKDKLSISDERIRLTTEVLAAAKVVKLYSWEAAFKQKILNIRDRELGALRRLGYIYSIMSIIFTSSTLIISLLTLSVYATWGGDGFTEGKLTPQTVFVSMTLFSMLRNPIGALAEATSITLQAIVSTKRIEQFLLLEEVQDSDVTREPSLPESPDAPLITIREGTFAWTKSVPTPSDGEFDDDVDDRTPLLANSESEVNESRHHGSTLENINLSAMNKSITAIVGRVGQGKSSLLSAIIGEMYKTHGEVFTRGRIAYVPQHAWILNCSLRDNILFGKPYDHNRYERILHACGLEPDIAMLPAGDLTEIGERGINLSGGQKQRVSLARAAYDDADIYLLDDPLSAVDAHVDRHLWRNLIGPSGLLKDKARVLVTHGIHHLKDMDKIVMMKGGCIAELGTYTELMAEHKIFYLLIKEYAIKNRRQSVSADGPPSGDASAGLSPREEEEEEVRTEIDPSIVTQSELEYDDRSSDNDTLDTIEEQVEVELGATGQEVSKVSKISAEAERDAKGKIIETEKIMEGSISLETILVYVRAASYKNAALVILFHCIGQASLIGTSLWLKYWIKRTEESSGDHNGDDTPAPPSLKLFLAVFTLLTINYVFMCMLMIYINFVIARIRASFIIHRDLISKLLRLPASFFDTTPLGRIINRASSDIAVIDEGLPWAFDTLIMYFISVAASLIIVSVSTPVFLLALPAFMVAVLVIQHYYLHSSRALKRIFHVSKSPIFQHFNETLGGVSTIRAMRVQDRFINGNVTRIDANMNAHVAYTYSIRWVEVRLQSLAAVVILLVCIAFVFTRDTADPATAGLALSFALTITQDVNTLVRTYCDLQSRLVPVERVNEYIDLPTEAPERLPLLDRTKVWPPKHGAIRFDNYSARYREGLDLVLKGVSFEVQAGEKIGIVGRTGAGKSSLTLALFRMIEAAGSHWAKAANQNESPDDSGDNGGEDGGRIEIDGIDISTLGLVDLRQALAIIPQDPILFAGSIRDNLDPFLEHPDHLLWTALERAHLKDYIQSLPGGLSFEVSQNGENFSVGQRSLICLARALLRKTKILVMDEATSAVDVETDELIQRTIRTEFADRTILTIAHRIKTVMDSDKILVLEQGQVVEFDSPNVLLQRKDESLFYRLAEQSGEV